MASHSVMRCSGDLETELNSGVVMRHHVPHHIHVDGIHGSIGLHWLLSCEKVLQCVTSSKLQTGLISSEGT